MAGSEQAAGSRQLRRHSVKEWTMTARSLPPELQAYLDSIVDRCRHHYGARLRSVVLYGSVARTTFSATSDVDLLVVLADSTTSLGQRITEFIRGVADAPGIESAADTLRQMGCRVESSRSS
jgi:predicted nucleotidyltransferase